MTFADINKSFSAIVARYLASGYLLNAGTMGGSQGEIARADLTNGKEVIRVLVQTFHDYESVPYVEGVEIVEGRCNDRDVAPNVGDTGTIWNGSLDIIARKQFHTVDRDGEYFGTVEEARRARKVRRDRFNTRCSVGDVKREFTLTPELVEKFKAKIRARRGIRNVNTAAIKAGKDDDGYYYTYNGAFYRLH